MKRLMPVVLGLVGLACGVAAYAIWMLSDAHGHGLASGDRQAIIALGSASAVAWVAALVTFRRRRG